MSWSNHELISVENSIRLKWVNIYRINNHTYTDRNFFFLLIRSNFTPSLVADGLVVDELPLNLGHVHKGAILPPSRDERRLSDY